MTQCRLDATECTSEAGISHRRDSRWDHHCTGEAGISPPWTCAVTRARAGMKTRRMVGRSLSTISAFQGADDVVGVRFRVSDDANA